MKVIFCDLSKMILDNELKISDEKLRLFLDLLDSHKDLKFVPLIDFLFYEKQEDGGFIYTWFEHSDLIREINMNHNMALLYFPPYFSERQFPVEAVTNVFYKVKSLILESVVNTEKYYFKDVVVVTPSQFKSQFPKEFNERLLICDSFNEFNEEIINKIESILELEDNKNG